MTQDNDTTDDSSSGPDETQIHAEEVKDKHTTHWDLDYLSRQELEKAHREGQESSGEDDAADET